MELHSQVYKWINAVSTVYSIRFDDDSNKDVNSSITRNVMAVTKDPQYDVTLIKRKGTDIRLQNFIDK